MDLDPRAPRPRVLRPCAGRLGAGRRGVRGRRHVRGAARRRVHRRRDRARRLPGRRRRLPPGRSRSTSARRSRPSGTALAIGLVTKRAGIRQDTAIGVLFAGTFAFGVFLFSTINGYVADLFSFLFGNVLAIGPGDLVALLGAGPRGDRGRRRCSGRSCCTPPSTRSAPRRPGSRSSGSSTCSSRSSRSRSWSACRPSGSSSWWRCWSRRPPPPSCSRSGSRG